MNRFKSAGQLIYEKRKEKNYTQQIVAHSLGYKNHQFICQIEKGISAVPAEKIEDLCAILEIPWDVLVFHMALDYKEGLKAKMVNKENES